MERLDDFSSADLISALVDDLRVESTLFCRSLLTAPWGFAVAAPDLAVFHIVLAGRCHLAVDGVEKGVALAAGDLVILPQGQQHSVRDSPTSPVTALEDLLGAAGFEGFELRHGGGGPATELLCGGFAVGREAGALLSGLPPLVCVRGEDGRPVGWLADLLRLLRRELARAEPGARSVVARLADLLVAQALRAFLASRDGSALPPLRVLQDSHVAGAVAAIHEQPEHPWTVAELAMRAAMSRSAFAARFRELVGESPMHYVRRCRLARAAAYLRANDRSIFEIARLSGYDSAVSLTRAFRRQFGVPPGLSARSALGERLGAHACVIDAPGG